MRWAPFFVLCACHAAESKPPEAVVVALPQPEAPLAIVEREVGPATFTMVIDFSVLRAHPAAKQLERLVPALPMWKQGLASSRLDVMRDCDWISIEGSDVHDATNDVVLVHYSASDADVEAAIGALTRGPGALLDVGEPDVRAWRGPGSRVFLRPKNDHIVAMTPVEKSREWAHTLQASVVHAPHAGRAVDIRATNPKRLVPMMPAAFTEERIVVTAQEAGALLHVEADCPDEASAPLAAAELEHGVHKRNTLAVKMATGGAFSHFHATARGSMVVADIAVTPEQLDAVLKMTAAAEGADIDP